MTIIEDAREFAREKHAGQRRKYTAEPYFIHLEEVAVAAASAGLSEHAVAAAWLHDFVEDQPVALGEIEARFPSPTSPLPC